MVNADLQIPLSILRSQLYEIILHAKRGGCRCIEGFAVVSTAYLVQDGMVSTEPEVGEGEDYFLPNSFTLLIYPVPTAAGAVVESSGPLERAEDLVAWFFHWCKSREIELDGVPCALTEACMDTELKHLLPFPDDGSAVDGTN